MKLSIEMKRVVRLLRELPGARLVRYRAVPGLQREQVRIESEVLLPRAESVVKTGTFRALAERDLITNRDPRPGPMPVVTEYELTPDGRSQRIE